jgi:hypothetical protein
MVILDITQHVIHINFEFNGGSKDEHHHLGDKSSKPLFQRLRVEEMDTVLKVNMDNMLSYIEDYHQNNNDPLLDLDNRFLSFELNESVK